MGQAKNRGTFEQRKAKAIIRNQENAKRIKILLHDQDKEELIRKANMTPAQRKKRLAILKGFYSIPMGALGDFKVRI